MNLVEWIAEFDVASALLTGLGRLLGNQPVTPVRPGRVSRTDGGGAGQGSSGEGGVSVAALLFVDDGPDSVLGDPAGLHLVRSPRRGTPGSSLPPRLSSPLGRVPLPPAFTGRTTKFSLPPTDAGTPRDGSGDGSTSGTGLGALVSKDTRAQVSSWAGSLQSKLPAGKASLGAGLLSTTDGALNSFAVLMGRAGSASTERDGARPGRE